MEEPKVHHDIDEAFDVSADGYWPGWSELRLAVEDGLLVSTDTDAQVFVDFGEPVNRLGIVVSAPEGYLGDRFTLYYSSETPPAFDEARTQRLSIETGATLYLIRFDNLIYHLRFDPIERHGPTGIAKVEVRASKDEEEIRSWLAEVAEREDQPQLRTLDIVTDPDRRDAFAAYGAAQVRVEARARAKLRARDVRRPTSVEVVFDPQPNLLDPDTPLLEADVARIVHETLGVVPSIRTTNLGEISGVGLTLCIAQTALSATMERSNWELPRDLRELRSLCFMSAGSAILGLPGEHGYSPTRRTRSLLRLLFERPWRHGVRDRYTAELLSEAGVTNFEVVGTPSLWDLPDGYGADIPTSKGERVLFAADEYFHDPKNDLATLRRLGRLYDRVAIWPRNVPEPVEYAERLVELAGIGDVATILEPGAESLDAALAVPGTDFVGPNLEAAIHALKAGRRSLVLTADDRTTGVAELAHLPAIRRIEVADILEDWILASHETRLRIPKRAIDAWKAQFR